ncbi:MAG: DUF393 domain-containing protein [Phycisphaeraceae bacterium]
MTTERTNKTDDKGGRPEVRFVPDRGWVFYDGACDVCISGARRFDRMLCRAGFWTRPLQTPWVQQRLAAQGCDPADADQMWVLTCRGQWIGGADALVYLARRIWWTWPVWVLAHLPGVRPLLWRFYRWVAANRYRFGRTTCDLSTDRRTGGEA